MVLWYYTVIWDENKEWWLGHQRWNLKDQSLILRDSITVCSAMILSAVDVPESWSWFPSLIRGLCSIYLSILRYFSILSHEHFCSIPQDSMHVDMISPLLSAVYPSIQPFPSFFLSIRSFCFSGKWSKVLHVLMAHFLWLMAHGFSELHHDGIKTEQMCVCVCERESLLV